jgi:DNA processing protein
VLAFPGDVGRPKVAGCLALIRDGAILVRHAGDVLAALGRSPAPGDPAATGRPGGPRAAGLAGRLLELLDAGPADAAALVDRSEALPALALAALGELLATGEVAEGSDGRFRRAAPGGRRSAPDAVAGDRGRTDARTLPHRGGR